MIWRLVVQEPSLSQVNCSLKDTSLWRWINYWKSGGWNIMCFRQEISKVCQWHIGKMKGFQDLSCCADKLGPLNFLWKNQIKVDILCREKEAEPPIEAKLYPGITTGPCLPSHSSVCLSGCPSSCSVYLLISLQLHVKCGCLFIQTCVLLSV